MHAARGTLAGFASLAILGLSTGRAGHAESAGSREWWSVGVHAVDARGRHSTIIVRYFRFALGRGGELDSAELFVLDDATQRSEQSSVTMRATRTASAPPSGAAFSAEGWSLGAAAASSHAVAMRAGSPGGRIRIALELVPKKPAIPSLATRDGTSITRLTARGTLAWAGERVEVTGRAWLDHDRESPNDGPRARIGWERFELQLDDGRDVELFTSRLANDRYRVPAESGPATEGAGRQVADGTRIPVTGIVVSPAGRTTPLGRADAGLVWRANTLWRSGATDAAYPSLWSLTIPGAPPIAILETSLAQELRPRGAGIATWSGGAAIAEADPPGRSLGNAFVELTGFAVPTSL